MQHDNKLNNGLTIILIHVDPVIPIHEYKTNTLLKDVKHFLHVHHHRKKKSS